jgi:hypothetical protein
LGRHDFCTKPNKPARDESHHLNRPEQMRFMWGGQLSSGRARWVAERWTFRGEFGRDGERPWGDALRSFRPQGSHSP